MLSDGLTDQLSSQPPVLDGLDTPGDDESGESADIELAGPDLSHEQISVRVAGEYTQQRAQCLNGLGLPALSGCPTHGLSCFESASKNATPFPISSKAASRSAMTLSFGADSYSSCATCFSSSAMGTCSGDWLAPGFLWTARSRVPASVCCRHSSTLES